MKLGILANEFFDCDLGRMGGFGWAARQVAKFFGSRPDIGVQVVFLAGNLGDLCKNPKTCVHETKLILPSDEIKYRQAVREEKIDLILTVDYRDSYSNLLEILEETPVIVWVRDPKTPDVRATQETLEIPGSERVAPQGINTKHFDTFPPRHQRKVLFATPAPSLGDCIQDAYGIANQECTFLPNIVDVANGDISESQRPRVIFLARLDPIKRPWLFVELGRRFPDVEFLMLGQSHFNGRGSWEPRNLPENVKLLGHVDGPEKVKLLSSSWVLVNTSIHEALATSFLEALACETPILACTDQEKIVSRFGIFAGPLKGNGVEGLPYLQASLQRFLDDRSLRIRLGKQGRDWVEKTHNAANFLQAFEILCNAAGLEQHTRCNLRNNSICRHVK